MVSRPREEEYLGELVSGIKEIVKGRLVSFLYLFLFFLYIYFICMQLRTLRKLYYRIKYLLYIYIYIGCYLRVQKNRFWKLKQKLMLKIAHNLINKSRNFCILNFELLT